MRFLFRMRLLFAKSLLSSPKRNALAWHCHSSQTQVVPLELAAKLTCGSGQCDLSTYFSREILHRRIQAHKKHLSHRSIKRSVIGFDEKDGPRVN